MCVWMCVHVCVRGVFSHVCTPKARGGWYWVSAIMLHFRFWDRAVHWTCIGYIWYMESLKDQHSSTPPLLESQAHGTLIWRSKYQVFRLTRQALQQMSHWASPYILEITPSSRKQSQIAREAQKANFLSHVGRGIGTLTSIMLQEISRSEQNREF